MTHEILPLRGDLNEFLKRHKLEKKFEKQKRFFELNPHYPSLHTELMQATKDSKTKIYSFRIDRKFRAFFIYHGAGKVEVVAISEHP